MSLSTISQQNTHFPTFWELKAPDAKRDLIIKKIAVALIALLNFAALGAAIYFLVTYCPLPTQALLISPVIVGALAALAYLKFPTLGISSGNYSNYLNPASLAGRGLAYLFFGPLMYATKQLDWTPYHDPIVANRISKHLEKESFEKVAEEYGKHFDNIVHYGFIHETYLSEMEELYEEYKPLKSELKFWKKENLEDCEEAVQARAHKEALEARWSSLKKRFKYPFPHPQKTHYDFSRKTTQLKLKVRAVCCFGPPIEALRSFEA